MMMQHDGGMQLSGNTHTLNCCAGWLPAQRLDAQVCGAAAQLTQRTKPGRQAASSGRPEFVQLVCFSNNHIVLYCLIGWPTGNWKSHYFKLYILLP